MCGYFVSVVKLSIKIEIAVFVFFKNFNILNGKYFRTRLIVNNILLTIGIFADPDLCPDISAFAAALDAQFEAHL